MTEDGYINSRPLMIYWQDDRPRHPPPPQYVKHFPLDDRHHFAYDANGWVYLQYNCGWGWTNAGHISDYIQEGLQNLCLSLDDLKLLLDEKLY